MINPNNLDEVSTLIKNPEKYEKLEGLKIKALLIIQASYQEDENSDDSNHSDDSNYSEYKQIIAINMIPIK